MVGNNDYDFLAAQNGTANAINLESPVFTTDIIYAHAVNFRNTSR
jgi:hypothetical protein